MLNKVQLIGRIGKDPDIRSTQQGTTVANFSIATTEKWKDKQGDKQEKTQWHNIVCFSRLADIVNEYVSKGDLIYIEGKLQTEKYADKSGVEKQVTKILCGQLTMLSTFNKKSERNGEHKQEVHAEEEHVDFRNDEEDDIPF